MKIKDMTVGHRGTVVAFVGTDKAYRHKLLRMGLRKGVEFTLVRKAPMGDPLEIEIDGSKLTLRKAEADVVDVEPLAS